MSRLSAAYHGYNHQDLVTAYAMGSILLPRSSVRQVTAERKTSADDRFDDLELLGEARRRVQTKAHASPGRLLRLADLTTDALDFRIDRAVNSVTADPNPADFYTLFTTYPPDQDLLPFLHADRSTPPLLSGMETNRFKLLLKRVWPEGQRPAWRALENFEREVFAKFCGVFAIEVGCPTSSGDLREPGPLEHALLVLLRDGIGVGLFPNNNRDVADAAAHLVYAARQAREASQTVNEEDVVRALALKIDYGRVEEQFPINVDHVVQRTDLLDEIIQMLASSPRVAVTGTPGVGKSWLVQQLRSRLLQEGWVVAAHFCFVGLFDSDRYLRASITTTFGSLIAELYDADRSLLSDGIPRFAAGPTELEQLLRAAARADSSRRIAIVVDGLDHVDRLPGRSPHATAAEIVEELASLEIPNGVVIIVVSQPGDHLDEFVSVGSEYAFARWPDERIREIVQRSELEHALRANGLEGEATRIVSGVVDKAWGNPLYATYLIRTAVSVARQETDVSTADIEEYLTSAPVFDRDLNSYYAWLVDGLAKDTGVVWIAGMLALLDFAVTSDELKQIRPDFLAHIDHVLARLGPVLADDVVHGGVRIYHESFQRYMRARLDADPGVAVASLLAPVITWLDGRGFFADVRAFRSLFTLLKRVGRELELLDRVTNDFVALSAANAQAGEAVMGNIAAAASVAASRQDWPSLARLLEVSRACDYLYRWRFNVEHEIAEEYGRAYAEMFGSSSLSDRLLHDGRGTFLPRAGLLLCHLCDLKGAIPPWREYISAHNQDRRSDNSAYGKESDSAVAAARLAGRLRLRGRDSSIRDCIEWLNSGNRLPLHHYDVALELGRMYGDDALMAVIESLPAGSARAWARLGLIEMSESAGEAKAQAEAALRDGLPVDGWRACLNAGADPALLPARNVDLRALTDEVVSEDIQFHPERLRLWLTEIDHLALTDGEDAIGQIQLRIIPDSWFRKWLSFCMVLARRPSKPLELLESLRQLSEDVEVFKGKPRACDLYQLHDEIRASFRDVLVRLDGAQWRQSIRTLAKISSATSTWVTGSRSGPLPVDAMFDLCLETADTAEKRKASSELAAELLGPEERTGEFYDTHARDSLLLARIHMASGQQELAGAAWRDACTYLMGYGWRKDITVYEILDPLGTLGKADPIRTRDCIRRMQSIVERVLVHTDGKETRHAIHDWIDLAARIHPAGALSFLARREITRLPAFGDLDHALPHALAALTGQVSQLTLASGWLAAGSEAQSEPGAAIEACEKLIGTSGAGNVLWQAVIASLDGDGFDPPADLAVLAAASARRLDLPEPFIETTKVSKKDDQLSNYQPPDTRELSERLRPVLFTVPTTPLQIACAVRKWRDTRLGRANADKVNNAVGWRILEFVERGNEVEAEMVIRRLARDASSFDRDGLLADVAEGMKIRGHAKLAALASTLAYTSGRDGWLHFGGSDAFMLEAIQLDPGLAWSTLADELAGLVARGGCTFTTKRLIELQIADGRLDEAFAGRRRRHRL